MDDKKNPVATVIVAELYLRQTPDTAGPPVGILQLGDTARVFNESNGWLRVKVISGSLSGKNGFVMSAFTVLHDKPNS